MFSMAVAAMRQRRIVAAAALAAALLAPGAAAAAAAAPAAQASVVQSAAHQRLRREPGRQRGAELGRTARDRLLVLLRRVQLLPGLRLLGPGNGGLRPRRRDLAAAFDLLDAGQPAPAPDPAVAGPARRPDVLRLRARGDQHDLVPPDVRGASQRASASAGAPGARGGIPRPRTGSGNPGQTARRHGAVPRPPAPGIPACVRSGCWRVRHCAEKACAVITLPPSLLPRHPLCSATRPLAVSAWPAGVLTDRVMTCQAANCPSPSPNRLWLAHFPVMSLLGHSASRAPRSQDATGCPAYITVHCSSVEMRAHAAERAHLARFRARLRQPVRLRGCCSDVPAASQQPDLQLKPR